VARVGDGLLVTPGMDDGVAVFVLRGVLVAAGLGVDGPG
jgi:hypothetical protein